MIHDQSEEHLPPLLPEEVPGPVVAGAARLDGEEEVVVPRGGRPRQGKLQLGQLLGGRETKFGYLF